jgi:hypothetical protein
MKQIHSFVSRFRLLGSFAALAILLGALAVPPVRAEICEDGCVNWNASQGCIECQHCCSYDDGHFECHQINNRVCGT